MIGVCKSPPSLISSDLQGWRPVWSAGFQWSPHTINTASSVVPFVLAASFSLVPRCGECFSGAVFEANSPSGSTLKTVMKMGMMIRLALAVLAVGLVVPSCVEGAPRGWGYAHITFYGTPNGGGQASSGACAYQNTYALGYGAMTAALSTPLFKAGAACGACYQIRCKRIRETRTAKNWCWSYSRSITITATNMCPPGSTGGWCDPPKHHFDLSYPAYATLARREGGVAPVWYRRVACRKRGGIRFTVGGNPWFFMILIHNIAGAGDVRALKIKCPYTGWVAMYRNWGALWTVRRQMRGPLSFMITASDGRTVVSRNAVGNHWKFGQTWEGRAQFRVY